MYGKDGDDRFTSSGQGQKASSFSPTSASEVEQDRFISRALLLVLSLWGHPIKMLNICGTLMVAQHWLSKIKDDSFFAPQAILIL